jgi:hypothetical protein
MDVESRIRERTMHARAAEAVGWRRSIAAVPRVVALESSAKLPRGVAGM